MNLIADNLFSVLLGWTRSLFNSLWNMLTNNSAGFTGFLQRFWLPLIIVLLVFGTLTDYIIWLIRWRPYYVWSAWLRKRIGQRRLNQTQHFMEDLDHSPLDLPEYQMPYEDEDRSRLMDEPVYFDFQPDNPPLTAEQQTSDGFQQAAAFMEEPPLFTPSLPWEDALQSGTVPGNEQEAWAAETRDEDAIMQETMLQNQWNYFQRQELPVSRNPETYPMAAENGQVAPGSARRRRAGTKRQRGKEMLRSIKDTFFSPGDASGSIDSLQSPVSQEDAFHKPFYPQNYAYREQPPNKSGNGTQE